jgi:hypothetical protein
LSSTKKVLSSFVFTKTSDKKSLFNFLISSGERLGGSVMKGSKRVLVVVDSVMKGREGEGEGEGEEERKSVGKKPSKFQPNPESFFCQIEQKRSCIPAP